MALNTPEDAMPWVGVYIAIASLACTLAMTVDTIRSFWQWKFWFPNKFFTLNASTITLMAIALKLPVDLTTEMNETEAYATKVNGIYFMFVMLANFVPSLGLLDEKELLMNTVALGILVITILVNISIQLYTRVIEPFALDVYIFVLLFPFLWPFSAALTVPASRKRLEQRYKESQQMVSNNELKRFSSKELRGYLKRYWMMTETRSPQFVIACSPVSSACGVICAYIAMTSLANFIVGNISFYTISDYKWSINMIFIIQSTGIVVGSIAPIFRCITSIGHYSLSTNWSKNQLNVFRVEKHWIQTLQRWKHIHVHSHIPGRYCKIVFHEVKKTFLNLCLTLHILVLVECKLISLVPRTFLLVLSYTWHLLKSVLKWFKKVAKVSSRNESSEIEEYARYVVQIEEEAKLSNRILRNTLHSITQVLDASEKKEPGYVIKFLEKSKGFDGVLEFDNDQDHENTYNCWSLVVVTLTTIALALPNIANSHFKRLLSSMREGLDIVRQVEECLNVDSDSVKARKAAKRVWTEVELYRSWLQIDLQRDACKGKTSKEILKWFGQEATKILTNYNNKKPSIDHSPYKVIVASSMYRISQTILSQCDEQQKLSDNEVLLEWISTMIADILSACFTNLPRVIKMKCQHHAIEERGDSIRNAAQLLGKSKKILKNLKARELPNLDQDSMAYIDKWRGITRSQSLNNGDQIPTPTDDASSTEIQPGSSSSNESLILSVM